MANRMVQSARSALAARADRNAPQSRKIAVSSVNQTNQAAGPKSAQSR